MRRASPIRRVVITGAVAAAMLAIAAATALGVPRAGSASDPYDSLVPVGSRFPDVTRVATTYAPEDGTLSVSLGLHEPLATVLAPGAAEEIQLDLSVGGLGADGRTCDAPDAAGAGGRTGDLRISLGAAGNGPLESVQMYYSTSAQVVGDPSSLDSHGEGPISADRGTLTWTLPTHTALVHRDYRCVTDIGLVSSHAWSTPDEVAPFFFTGFAPPAVSDGGFLNEELYAPWACVQRRTVVLR